MKRLFILDDLFFVKGFTISCLVRSKTKEQALKIFCEEFPTEEISGIWKATPLEISKFIENGYLSE